MIMAMTRRLVDFIQGALGDLFVDLGTPQVPILMDGRRWAQF